MIITNQLKNQHLLWRAGFGPLAEDYSQLSGSTPNAWYKALVKASSPSPAMIDVADNMLKGLVMGIDDVVQLQKKQLSDDQKKQLRKQSSEDIKSLNLAWLNTMISSDAQLREKTALFWHGHFASRNLNIFYQQLLLDVIRKNALGNFGTLLREVSKSAAMINFLNNNQNKKDHPNENFAREVMELFTMGRGNYTEQDVKEAARAFTGWGATLQGEFVFRRFQHDAGSKTFLGRTGNFNGDEILDILLEQKQTAYFITKKIWRFFVHDTPDEKLIAWLSERFFQSNYAVDALLQDIFTADWFYTEKNIGSRIKSPVELLVGIRRTLPMTLEEEDIQLLLQQLLGQLLFNPPNVAGWPGGTNWIDSSSLMFRLKIPQMLFVGDEVQLQPKDDDDAQMGMKNENAKRMIRKGMNGGIIRSEIDWQTFTKQFDGTGREKLASAICKAILQTGTEPDAALLEKYADKTSRESYIRSVTIHLMSTPEYQLC